MNTKRLALGLVSQLALCIAASGPLAAGCADPGDSESDIDGQNDSSEEDASDVLATGRFVRAERPAAGRYMVILREGIQEATRDAAARLTARHQGETLHVYRAALRGFAVRLTEKEAIRLARDPDVAAVYEDAIVEAQWNQSSATWGLDRIDARSLGQNASYVYGPDGAGVHVYVIDAGLRASHDEFGDRVTEGRDALTDSDIAAGASTDCGSGHGTHVAGTIGGATYGVAKGVELHPVVVLPCATGSGYASDVAEGVDWVTAHAESPAVVNMSVGGDFYQPLEDSVQALIDSGVTVVVAAGNDNADACNYSPSGVADAITVGATFIHEDPVTHVKTDKRASFSNWGTCLDLFAPGDSIVSAGIASDTATATKSGTSMAAPHVTGVAALYLFAHPSASNSSVRSALRKSAAWDLVADAGTGSLNRLLNTGFRAATLRTASGKYLTAPNGGGGDLTATATTVGNFERFHLIDGHGGTLQSGDAVHLQAYNGTFMVAENGGSGDVNADRSIPYGWETFIIEKAGGGAIGNGDSVTLKAYDGKYVVANSGGGGAVSATSTTAGANETFVLGYPGW